MCFRKEEGKNIEGGGRRKKGKVEKKLEVNVVSKGESGGRKEGEENNKLGEKHEVIRMKQMEKRRDMAKIIE